MNAGAYGKEIKDVVEYVIYLDENLNFKKATKKEADFSYRESLFKQKGYFILSAVLKLEIGNRKKIEENMQNILKRRKEKQPLNFPSAGSVFKRPKNFFAADLIEKCGLKGKRINDAMVSEKHAGFIVNCGDATAFDVKELIKKIQNIVKIKKNVELKTEIIFIN